MANTAPWLVKKEVPTAPWLQAETEPNPEIQSGMPGGPKASQQELDAAKPGPGGVEKLPSVSENGIPITGNTETNSYMSPEDSQQFYKNQAAAKQVIVDGMV